MTGNEDVRLTYLYLRLAMVGLPIALGVSLGVEMAVGTSGDLGSISAYYYTAVRSVFVGSIIAMGLALIAIREPDQGGADTLLNLAGLLAPFVALVPTPLKEGERLNGDSVTCPHFDRCIPGDLVDGVVNNSVAYLVVATLGVVLAGVMARRAGGLSRSVLVGLALSAFLVLVAWVLLLVPGLQPFFLAGAHYAAAVPMFALLVYVIWLHSVRTKETGVRLAALPYWRVYRVLTVLTAAVLVVGVVYGALLLGVPDAKWTPWLFVVEATLLGAFTIFWAVQTWERVTTA